MRLFWHSTGPLIVHDGEMLRVEDLNPETKIRFRMSRGELLSLGLRCIGAAIVGPHWFDLRAS